MLRRLPERSLRPLDPGRAGETGQQDVRKRSMRVATQNFRGVKAAHEAKNAN
jgi:hypothetical protein